jgi:endonuclease/exonuclease/phosphatase (EEP) superfamily protein YafD
MITHALARPIVYRAGIRRLHRLAVNLAQRFPVIVGGDWNVPHMWDERTKLRGFPVAAFRGWSSRSTVRPTRHRSRPDWFLWRGLRFDSIARVTPTYSDHDGVRLRLD